MQPARFDLPERVTLGEASGVCRNALAALRAAAPQGPWLIEGGALRQFDSSCLALLLELRRSCTELRLHALPERLLKLARAYGVETQIDG